MEQIKIIGDNVSQVKEYLLNNGFNISENGKIIYVSNEVPEQSCFVWIKNPEKNNYHQELEYTKKLLKRFHVDYVMVKNITYDNMNYCFSIGSKGNRITVVHNEEELYQYLNIILMQG